MNVQIISMSYGAFIVHTDDCPFLDFDWNRDGINQYEMSAASVNEIAQEMQCQEAPHQNLGIVTKRVICHFCVGSRFPGSNIKPR